jgi:hypothetical protein
MSPRIRDTRKVRMSSRAWSRPTTYQTPFSEWSAYGSSVRSATSLGREIVQYENLTVRCFEIALSSFVRRPAISGE